MRTRDRARARHRALIEAGRYGAGQAVMLVHAFAEPGESFEDYRRFARALGIDGAEQDAVTTGKVLRSVDFASLGCRTKPR